MFMKINPSIPTSMPDVDVWACRGDSRVRAYVAVRFAPLFSNNALLSLMRAMHERIL